MKYKKEVKQIIKAGIPQENLLLFKFHKSIYENEVNGFKWTKKNEFRYKNEMYDIIKTEYKSDSVYFSCFHDLKESGLFKNLDKAIAKFIRTNTDKQNELTSTITSINKYYYSYHDYILDDFLKSSKLKYHLRSGKILKGFYLTISPPPNLNFYS